MYSSLFSKRTNFPVSAGLMGLILMGLMLMTLTLAPSAMHAQRRRIAVMSLDVSPDARAKAAAQFGMQNDLGASLADLIINKLVTDGKFIVIERAALDKIVKEQNFSNSDRADPTTAAKLGKLAGVDAIVIGSITQFGGEQEKSKLGIASGRFSPLGQLSQSKSTVTVGVTARLIDVTTGAILSSATGTGTSTKSKTGTNTNIVAYDTSSKDFPSTSVGEATTQAIGQVVTQIEAAPLPTAAPPPPPAARTPYKGVIADVSGSTLVLTVGTSAGVKVGDTIEVSRPTRTIKDPTTGAVLRVLSDKLGEAKITEADATSSVATYSGTAVVKVKDQVNSEP